MCSETFVVLVLMATLTVASADRRTKLRVIKGVDAGANDYPFVVALAFHVANAILRVCTGSLITETWTLTAGHCVRETAPEEDGRVLFGNLTVMPHITKEFKNILEVIKLSNYMVRLDQVNAKNDIALLRTDPIPLKTFGKISAVDYQSLIGYKVRCVGTGSTKTDDEYKRPLKFTFELMLADQVRPKQVCNAVVVKCADLDILVYPVICLAPLCANKLQRVQVGDSGGPLFHRGKIVGVATSVISQYKYLGKQRYGDTMLFTPISPSLNWIENNISR